jgi:hypothetical protein
MMLHPQGVRGISKGFFKGTVCASSALDRFIRDGGNPEELFSGKFPLLKSCRSTRTIIVKIPYSNPASRTEEVFIKEYRFKNPIHSFYPLFTMHRAQRVWETSWYLLKCGISVPRPIGYLIKRIGPYCIKGYAFSSVLAECDSLHDLAQGDIDALKARLESNGIVDMLAGNVALMHQSGVSHGDLKWSNILLHKKENSLWFVDLDATEIHKNTDALVPFARDLARFVLNAGEAGFDKTFTDRFLDGYAYERGLARNQMDKQVERILEKLAERHRRKKIAAH